VVFLLAFVVEGELVGDLVGGGTLSSSATEASSP
jgi:hypothetical protein